jgi:hypothetical protein
MHSGGKGDALSAKPVSMPTTLMFDSNDLAIAKC